ncbi:MAG: hypothetical protein GXO94_00375 [Nitrospirae bacterium]|nr:hypothetical protein [Nitrospirota bacterium]
MRITLTLRPVRRDVTLPVNYNYFLTTMIYGILGRSSEDFSSFLHDEGFKLGGSRKGFKLFTYSMLMGKDVSVSGDRILFGGDNVRWHISSPVDAFVEHLIAGVFAAGQEIRIGPEGAEASFLIERVETQPVPVFKESMRFTCLSPVTVSKVVDGVFPPGGSNGWSRSSDSCGRRGHSRCHYIRPWEEGFSDAVRRNLEKKHELLTGFRPDSPDFSIRIDEEYMNRRAGKIMKKINFKGTDIVGFLAPFEVRGNPDLIRVGYETGFGEKGSMGFGMVKEITQAYAKQRTTGPGKGTASVKNGSSDRSAFRDGRLN